MLQPTKNITIRFPLDEWDRMFQRSVVEKRSMGSQVRIACKVYLDSVERIERKNLRERGL